MPLDEVHFISAYDRQQYESLFEPNTRLPLRALLIDRIAVALLRARRVNRFVALLVFSDIKSGAAPMPDLEVQYVAQIMQARMRPDDTVARTGPLAIVAVCNGVDSYDEADLIAQRLTQESDIECRVGITCSDHLRDAEMLLMVAVDHLSLT